MKVRLMFLLLLFIGAQISYGKNTAYQDFDKAHLYNVLKSGNLQEVNEEIEKVNAAAIKEKQAYAGTLMMKKAGLLKKPKDKLSTFKAGAVKLETTIASDNENAEYRFLRLIIQEHAPKITKYRKQIDNDTAFIKAHYNSLQPSVQAAVRDYAESSKYLKAEDFK